MYIVIDRIEEGGHTKSYRTVVNEFATEEDLLGWIKRQYAVVLNRIKVYEAVERKVRISLENSSERLPDDRREEFLNIGEINH